MDHPAESPFLEPGAVLGDRFHVHALLGRGGMGAVYAVWDAHHGRDVALKLMGERFVHDAHAQARFRREGELLARVRHPAIVAAYETGTLPDGKLFMVLELLRGETLAARIKRDAPIAAPDLVPLVDEVCSALGAAHAQGLVHRDIKPSNIFLVSDAAVPRVRLLDFGVAKPLDRERLTSTGVVVGTVLYMAPEQLAGEAVDARADVYAVGVVLHEALTGRHPFSARDDEHLSTAILVGRASPIAGVTPQVAAVVNRAMARARSERFASAEALAAAFRQAVTAPASASASAPGPGLALAETVKTRRPGLAAAVPATAVPATPVPTTREHVPQRPPKRRSRALPMLSVPLILACGISGVGLVTYQACDGAITEHEMSQLRIRLGPAIANSPQAAEYERDLAALQRLEAEGKSSMWTISLLATELEEALEDGRVDEEELGFIMGRVRDAVKRGGEYGFSRFWEIISEDAERDTARRRAREIERDKREASAGG